MSINLSSRKSKLIILSILFVIFVATGGYLLWRVNQPETVAPEDSEAGWSQCYTANNFDPDGYLLMCSGGSSKPSPGVCYRSDGTCWASCSCPSTPSPTPNCGDRVASDVGKAVGSRCQGKGSYTYECGAWCYLQSNGANCCVSTPTPTTYTVTYNANSGNCTPSSRTVESGNNAAAPSCTRTGHNLTGFTRTSGSGGSLNASTGAVSNVTGNQTIRANWQSTGYTVTYNANGGTCTPTSRSVNHGQSAVGPTCTRTGHNLKSFTRTSGTGGTFNSTTGGVSSVTNNQTVRADWEIKTYTLTYTAGANGTLQGNASQTVNHGSSGTAVTANPSTGYFFGGWSDGKSNNPRTDSNVTAVLNVTATFSISCGNGVCDPATENAQNCPTDCPAVCGDGYCTHDETNETCPEDCSANCGDGYCDPETENAANCPEDCSADCGDGICSHDENALTCPEDCPAVCGDGYCTHDENMENCPEDCGYPVDSSIPETGIFDNSQTAVLVGFALLLLGFTWRILGRSMYISVTFLGKIPKKISIHMKDVKQERILKQNRKRKQKFEKKVVKD